MRRRFLADLKGGGSCSDAMGSSDPKAPAATLERTRHASLARVLYICKCLSIYVFEYMII